MTKHIYQPQKVTIAYDTETGASTLMIKDKELFPNGFLYEFSKTSFPATRIRQHLGGEITESDWITQADAEYGAMTERHLNYKGEPKRQPHLYLGADHHDATSVHHNPFGSGAQATGNPENENTWAKNLMIQGFPGKSVLLKFLFCQQQLIAPEAASLFYFDLRHELAEIVHPGDPGIELVPVLEAVSRLYDVEGPTIAFVDGLDATSGPSRVIAGALESMIRSKHNRSHLAFFVTKQEADAAEGRFYNRVITAGVDGGGRRGVYSMSSPITPGRAPEIFHTPSVEMMFGDKIDILSK